MENGKFKGKLWVFELLADKAPPKSPNYVEFIPDRSKILVYKDEQTTVKGVKVEPLLDFDVMNLEFPCDEDKSTCTVSEFTDYITEKESRDPGKIRMYKYEV